MKAGGTVRWILLLTVLLTGCCPDNPGALIGDDDAFHRNDPVRITRGFDKGATGCVVAKYEGKYYVEP